MINPVLRGWVNYFRVGDSHRCFSMIKYWVEKKIRRHLMRARGRKGMGWKRWSREWIYGTLGLFNDYRVADSYSRKQPQHHTSHNPCHEASRKAHCGKTARWV
jgi:RNA-directed DNA polymerase